LLSLTLLMLVHGLLQLHELLLWLSFALLLRLLSANAFLVERLLI
jgi:hypothetical protein